MADQPRYETVFGYKVKWLPFTAGGQVVGLVVTEIDDGADIGDAKLNEIKIFLTQKYVRK